MPAVGGARPVGGAGAPAIGGAPAGGGSAGSVGTAGGAVGGSGGGGAGAGVAGAPVSAGGHGNTTGGGRGGAGTGGSGGVGAGGSAGTTSGEAGSTGSDGNPDAAASAATATIPGSGCTPPAAYANLFISLLGETQDSSNAKLEAAWNQLYNPSNANTVFYNGGTGEAYVKDIADNDVRSEGQSYGMMTALQLNHQTEFDALWTFAKNHMVKGSGSSISSITWSVATSGGSNGKSGGAPDGDEWFAAALVFAHNRWGDKSGKYAYGTEAQAVLNMVRTSDFDAPSHLVRYYAGTSSNGTDGSYVLPAFYQTWACFDTANADFWNAAVTAARTFFHNAADSNGVIGDQSSFSGSTTNSSGDDKLRCVANIMSDHNFFNADPWQTQTYATEYGAHEAKGTSSTAELACDGLLGFGLPASSGQTFVQKLWSAAIPSGQWRYYDGTLYTLALLQVSGAFRLWY